MKILIIDPHGLAQEAFQHGDAVGNDILRSHGILETVWMLGVEHPQAVVIIRPPGPDVDWVKLSRITCPLAHVVCLPVSGQPRETCSRLQEFWQQLPSPALP